MLLHLLFTLSVWIVISVALYLIGGFMLSIAQMSINLIGGFLKDNSILIGFVGAIVYLIWGYRPIARY